MYISIDESGQHGTKGRQNPFVLAAVIVPTLDEYNRAVARIDKLAKDLQMNERSEFHFTKLSDENRKVFLSCVLDIDFGYFAYCLPKNKLKSDSWNNKEFFWRHATSQLATLMGPSVVDAIVLMDKTDDRHLNRLNEQCLIKYCGMHEKKRRIKSVSHVRSHSNRLVQMADMVCGSIGRSMTGQHCFRKILAPKERCVKVFS